MISWLTHLTRSHIRARRRAAEYVAMLPHFQLHDGAMQTLGAGPQPMDRRIIDALRLCDGTRTLAAVARRAGVNPTRLARLHERGMLVLWPHSLPAVPPNLPTNLASSRLKIIVSPHLDDAALSLGGMMLLWVRADFHVLVLNVFSRSTWWRFDTGTPEQISSTRRAEENLVLRLAQASARFLDLPEALQRGQTMQTLFTAPPGHADRAATDAIALAVAELAEQYPHAHWLLPLGLGGHIDHRLARDAAWHALSHRTAPPRIAFYEDQPYAAENDQRLLHTIPGMLEHPDRERLEPTEYRLADALALKLEMLRVYWSQFTWPRIATVGLYAQHLTRDGAAERVWNFGE